MFLQSVGLIPDNMIFINTKRDLSEISVSERLKAEKSNPNELKTLVKESVDQSDLNINSLKDIYKGFFSENQRQSKEKKEEEVIIEDIAV
jgi:hypothetical protein